MKVTLADSLKINAGSEAAHFGYMAHISHMQELDWASNLASLRFFQLLKGDVALDAPGCYAG